MAETFTLREAAERVGVSPSTLKRWADAGLIPGLRGAGTWTLAAVSHARIVARLRERGHGLERIRRAGKQGRLAYAFIETLFADQPAEYTLREASSETGMEPRLVERFWTSIGLPAAELEALSEDDAGALRYAASVLAAGFPVVPFLQLCRVYGQALLQIADAEVRLFHLYVHEPLMREGVPGLQMAEQMEGLAGDLLPIASPLMDFMHRRFLQHIVEQDVVGHMETELEDEGDLGRVRTAIAFADLAGYTRFTEEEGDEEALSLVDHWGTSLYRDGDYFGREVNLASRVARARGGEVLVTDAVGKAVRGSSHLRFEGIGEVKLKGFDEPRRLCRATRRST